ncbi:hypothetical protein GGG16DRAFT_106824 [Schizophyllum commune]
MSQGLIAGFRTFYRVAMSLAYSELQQKLTRGRGRCAAARRIEIRIDFVREVFLEPIAGAQFMCYALDDVGECDSRAFPPFLEKQPTNITAIEPILESLHELDPRERSALVPRSRRLLWRFLWECENTDRGDVFLPPAQASTSRREVRGQRGLASSRIFASRIGQLTGRTAAGTGATAVAPDLRSYFIRLTMSSRIGVALSDKRTQSHRNRGHLQHRLPLLVHRGLGPLNVFDGVSLRGRRAPKLIDKGLRVRPQTQNYRISTSNAPRPARESLADRRESICTGEGGGAERHLVDSVQAPDASCGRLWDFLRPPPNAKLSHFDAKCAEGRAGNSLCVIERHTLAFMDAKLAHIDVECAGGVAMLAGWGRGGGCGVTHRFLERRRSPPAWLSSPTVPLGAVAPTSSGVVAHRVVVSAALGESLSSRALSMPLLPPVRHSLLLDTHWTHCPTP